MGVALRCYIKLQKNLGSEVLLENHLSLLWAVSDAMRYMMLLAFVAVGYLDAGCTESARPSTHVHSDEAMNFLYADSALPFDH